MLERLFDYESGSRELGSGLAHEVDDAEGRVAVGQEVVDEQHPVALAEVVSADADVVVPVLGEGVDSGGEHVVHGARLLFLGEHDRQFHQVAGHDGRGDSARLDRENLVRPAAAEPSDEFLGYGSHQLRVHLMVDEAVHFQDASLEAFPVVQYALFEQVHVVSVYMCACGWLSCCCRVL